MYECVFVCYREKCSREMKCVCVCVCVCVCLCEQEWNEHGPNILHKKMFWTRLRMLLDRLTDLLILPFRIPPTIYHSSIKRYNGEHQKTCKRNTHFSSGPSILIFLFFPPVTPQSLASLLPSSLPPGDVQMIVFDPHMLTYVCLTWCIQGSPRLFVV